MENAGRLYRQRAVNVYREIPVPLYKVLFLYLADEVKHFLRAADRKAGYDNIAAAVEGAL